MASLLSKMARRSFRQERRQMVDTQLKMDRHTLPQFPEGTRVELEKTSFWIKDGKTAEPYNSMTEEEAKERGFICRSIKVLKPVGHERNGI